MTSIGLSHDWAPIAPLPEHLPETHLAVVDKIAAYKEA